MLHNDLESEHDVVVAKIVAGSCLFVISVICGVLPFKLSEIFNWTEPIDSDGGSNKKSSKIVTGLLCFGGGVLLATTFLHLLPEVSNEIEVLQSSGVIPNSNLNYAQILMMTGFFLIYLIEEIVHYCIHKYQHRMKSSQASLTMKPEDETLSEAFMRGMSARNSIHRGNDEENTQSHSNRNSMNLLEAATDSKVLSTVLESKVQKLSNDIRDEKVMINENVLQCNNNKNHKKHNSHQHHQHGHGHSHTIPMNHSDDDQDVLVSSLRGLLIVLALSIHELFEGFAGKASFLIRHFLN
jgi:zinc transporter 1/2/3